MYTSSWNYPVIIWRISKSGDLNLRDDTVKLSRQIREDADEWSNTIVLLKLLNYYQVR